MWHNYLKIALRCLYNQRVYSAINVLGLAVGLTSFLLIVLFVRHELSYDRFHPASDQLYRLAIDFDNGDRYWASNQYHFVPALQESMPGIELAGRMMVANIPVRRGAEAYNEAGFRLIDPEILQLFAFTWLQGDPAGALSRPFTLVLTESAARRYFGNDDPLGQALEVNNQAPMTVTGVIADLPDNTHLSGEIFTAISTGVMAYGEQRLAETFDFHSYARISEVADIGALTAQMSTLLKGLVPGFGADLAVRVDRVADVHLNPLRNEMPGTPGSVSILYTFSVIAVGILAIACINFTNLSIARSAQRAREVGMRKSVGAGRRQLIAQFLGESLLNSVLAMACALVLVELLLPSFRSFVGKDIQMGLFDDLIWVAFLAGVALLVGIVAGSYPALYLARFEPAKVLKGHIGQGNAGRLFRNLLVVGQFSMAIILIIGTTVIYSQMQYARQLDSGYRKDGILILNGSATEALGTQWETMKRELLAHPEITHVTASRIAPGVDNFSGNAIWYEGAPPSGTQITFLPVDFNYFEAYEIATLSGRTFEDHLATDRMQFPFGEQAPSAAWILNESAARMLGWSPEEALQKSLTWGSADGLTGPVIGVVEDVLYESVRTPLKPLLYMVTASAYGGATSPLALRTASVRITGNNLANTLAHIDSTWATFMPGSPVDRYFLDTNVEQMYGTEAKQGQLLGYFSVLAVLIACLGLYGLTTFDSERRTREIGVRKVMGSSVWGIVLLLTNDFSKLVLIANVIAWPLAWVAMNRWLEQFAYRIDLTPMIFIGSGLIALCVAWVTVGGTAAKAASRKPVWALRYE